MKSKSKIIYWVLVGRLWIILTFGNFQLLHFLQLFITKSEMKMEPFVKGSQLKLPLLFLFLLLNFKISRITFTNCKLACFSFDLLSLIILLYDKELRKNYYWYWNIIYSATLILNLKILLTFCHIWNDTLLLFFEIMLLPIWLIFHMSRSTVFL